MNARALIEKLVGPSDEDVARIVGIIRRSQTWHDANAQLAPYRVQFTDSHRYFTQSNALAGFDSEQGTTLLNARYFGRHVNWTTAIEHEETHRAQMGRAKARGGDMAKISQDQEKYFFDKGGNVRYDRYMRHPLEMQALARNAITTARAQGEDPEALMRSGTLAKHAPITPLNTKRFGKYASQMLRTEGRLPFTKSVMERALLLAATMLTDSDVQILRACSSCEDEFGPMKGGDKSHSYCKRHWLEVLQSLGSASAQLAKYDQMPEESFPPDLAQHPELIERDPATVAEWHRRRAQYKSSTSSGISV